MGGITKVGQFIGQTMQLHLTVMQPGEALVNRDQKIDDRHTGQLGDYRTGDLAAAPRYIEARLSKVCRI